MSSSLAERQVDNVHPSMHANDYRAMFVWKHVHIGTEGRMVMIAIDINMQKLMIKAEAGAVVRLEKY